ncbi:hypothetical protein ACLMJK_008077 [Lecanora helva]
MAGNPKRKWRWSSRSLLASIAPNKAYKIQDPVIDTQDGAMDQRCTNSGSLDERSWDYSHNQTGVAARMRRSGSKFLHRVGLQRNGEAPFTKKTSTTVNERDVAIAIARDAATSSQSAMLRTEVMGAVDLSEVHQKPTDAQFAVPNDTTSAGDLPPLAQTKGVHLAIADHPKMSCQPDRISPTSSDMLLSNQGPAGLRQNKANSGLTHQLSHRLSSTFGNPTVVHRPSMRTRPTLLSMHEELPKGSHIPVDHVPSPQDSTAPSSYNTSGSTSAGEPSTAKTSLESNVASLRSAKDSDVKERSNGAANLGFAQEITREKPLTPIQEAPLTVTPTVVTVETTANAKIFFETHFNSLLAGHASPRSVRRHHLESLLEDHSVPEEQRQRERAIWIALESGHLRQIRVMKSKGCAMDVGSGVSVAGFEVVRILGKGSFGVVRLVREIEATPTSSPLLVPSTAQDANKKPTSREEVSNLKATAIGALKATLDGQKTPQRPNHKRSKKDVYAMKVIRKSDMLRNCQEGHLRAERDFLVASESSKWVVPLIASFQDTTNLYLVMEYMVGGDFLGLLFRKDILKERHARWYIAEMILCVEEAHRLRWIHRDVKPDNFLISASGHLKISDFGLAFDGHWAHDQRYFKDHRQSLMEKLGIHVKGDLQDQEEDAKKDVQTNLAGILTGRRSRHRKAQVDGPSERESILQWRNRHGKRRLAGSVVGTSQYMAPEVIRGEPYDGRCDWWSIGIILFEVSNSRAPSECLTDLTYKTKCLYGYTPFVCDNREDTKAKILANAKSLIFPDEREVDRREKVSFDAMDLINSLLQETEHRLSSKKYQLNDFQQSRRTAGQHGSKFADPHALDCQVNFVYPDDATDIKAHPFFRRIAWDRLHLTRPPFVPDVSSRDDTKYFDEEEPISDVDDAATISNSPEASREDLLAIDTVNITQFDGPQLPRESRWDSAVNGQADAAKDINRTALDKVRGRKRPRDKVLRDKEVGRRVLELRKRGAFLGYTYRRPHLPTFDEERGRHRVSKRSQIPSFD